jgi:hypothetical protein
MMEATAQYFQRRNTKVQAIFFSAFNPQAFDALREEAKAMAHSSPGQL